MLQANYQFVKLIYTAFADTKFIYSGYSDLMYIILTHVEVCVEVLHIMDYRYVLAAIG